MSLRLNILCKNSDEIYTVSLNQEYTEINHGRFMYIRTLGNGCIHLSWFTRHTSA